MAIDQENNPSNGCAGPVPIEESSSSKKNKARETKKVGHPFSCTPHSPITPHHPENSSQVPEKRPEVRFIDFPEVPGIIIGPRFQKFLKKMKVDHPPSDTRASSCF